MCGIFGFISVRTSIPTLLPSHASTRQATKAIGPVRSMTDTLNHPPLDDRQPQSAEELNTSLDNSWSQYLSLLDQYQDLRQQLASDISTASPLFKGCYFRKSPDLLLHRDT